MKTLYNYSYLAWFSKYFDKNNVQSAVLVLVFDDVTSRVNLLKLLHVGLNFFETFLKML